MDSVSPIRLGILGTGQIGHQLLAGARGTSAVTAVAVGSRDMAKGRAFAARHDLATVHGSYEDLLADPGVDAIYISLPNSLHHEWTMHALQAGKHVLVEKPYSAHPEEVEAAFSLAERSNLVLMEAFMWRLGPGAQLIREYLPQIGEVRTIRTSFSFVVRSQADVRLDPALAGGSLMDVGCYSVSGARLAAGGEPTRVSGAATWGPSGVDLRFHGQLEFRSGVVAQIASGFDSNDRGIQVVGADGWFSLRDPWRNEPPIAFLNGNRVDYEPHDQYTLELEELVAVIRGERLPEIGRDDALGQARTIQALYRSARSGALVEL
jgi:D-xylose 1-dehydrogenase (NADP+, D-xylono-1,5-lactone-forming)